MLNLKKVILLAFAAFGFAVTAQTASAQTIYSTFKNNTNAVVTITNVSWTGSYSPRIEGTYAIGTVGYGEHRFANATYNRYTSMSFRATWTDIVSGATKTCIFSYDFRSDTGAFSSGGGYAYNGTPTCGYTRSGYQFYFTPS